ncbi:hypothetical protein KP509_15G046400 [Ceratopteris richardii]|nr:hypothetical protein KP509_15G046400 [Ceratopteris richardii]
MVDYNFTMAIIAGMPGTGDYNIIWTANRLHAVSTSFISLRLRDDGNLVLLSEDMQTPIWSSDTAGKGVTTMTLFNDPISLVLRDLKGTIIWQSGDHPTDTLGNNNFLLPSQNLTSWASPIDPSPGRYTLVMEPCGLALYMMGARSSQRYWALDYNGRLSWEGTCRTHSQLAACISDAGTIEFNSNYANHMRCDYASGGLFPLYNVKLPDRSQNHFLLRLKYDGNLQVLSSISTDARQSTPQGCLLPNFCGPYGICMDGETVQCICPLNASFFSPVNSANSLEGCKPNHEVECNSSSRSQETMMLKVDGVEYVGNNYTEPLNLFSEEECKKHCENNCSCRLAFWRRDINACHHMDEVWSLHGGLNQSVFVTYVKVRVPKSSKKIIIMASVLSSLGVVVILVVSLLCKRLFLDKTEEEDDDDDLLLDAAEGLPSRFSYRKVHDITRGFERQLGKGGYGVVYAGQLPDGTPVAVKKLDSFNQGNKEFKAEVSIMGGISHYNLLRLRGFCAQKGHRILVYDYLENGSLDQWLFSVDPHRRAQLTWRVRCKIALGIAQGIAYLHNGTRERIIHLDIKPQNILLDQNFEPKVADFGLARLLKNSETHVMTAMRGTPGYLAPDWLKNGVIDEKCDVFSFGMLLMEIISGRKNLDNSKEPKEQVYYPEWAFQQAQEDNMAVLTDATLDSEEDITEIRRMIHIAFLCVLEDPTMRPSMTNVVNMLTGIVTVQCLELSRLQHGLLFVLRNPSSTGTHIGEILQDQVRSGTSVDHSSSAAAYMSSFMVNGR